MTYGVVIGGALAIGAALVAPVAAQTPLPMNTMTAGTIANGEQTDYVFVAARPGLLSVALVGAGDDDLYLDVRDDEGQRLIDGYADGDLQGRRGLERLSVVVPEAGTYTVTIGARSSGPRFDVGATFLEVPGLGSEPDPDGRPSRAQTLTVGKPVNDQVGPGDPWDWFVVKAPKAGTLVVSTTGDEGDLALEGHVGEVSDMADVRSDEDRDGKGVNEQITVEVTAGQSVYVRVVPVFTSTPTPYRITAAMQ